MAADVCEAGAGCGKRVTQELDLNWNRLIRQTHRWLLIAFTLAVILNLVFLMQKEQVLWVGLTALFPLILLLVSGLYLFALPYTAKWRNE
jgi:hypothetical protein